MKTKSSSGDHGRTAARPAASPCELHALCQATAAIGGSETTDDILSALVAAAPRVTAAQRCTVLLVDPERRELACAAATGVTPQAARKTHEYQKLADPPTPFQQEVLHAGRSTVIADVVTDPRLTASERDFLGRLGVRACLSVPLRVPGRSIGLLLIDDPERPHDFAEAETELAEAVAAQAALALDRAESLQRAREAARALERLNAELERRVDRRSSQLLEMESRRTAALRALVDAGIAITTELSLDRVLQRIVDVARGVLHARYAALGVLGEEPGVLERFVTSGMDEETQRRIGPLPTGRGILGAMLQEAKPLRLADLSQDPRSVGFPPGHPPMHSFLGVPIISRGRALGRLYFTEKQGAREFSAEDESLAISLAAQAAVAIENARLFQEVKEQQERLVRAERLQTIGTLASTVGHELRNPLSVISTAAYYLKTKLTDADERVTRNLDLMEREVRAATEIIESLLDFSRVRAPRLTPMSLLPLVREVVDRQVFPEGIEARVQVPEELPRVCIDEVQMHQVLRNLVENAVQAMGESGTLRVEGVACDGAVSLRVSDTGQGIAPENRERIFEPLFTTKNRGVGLGLALVRRVVEAHGGTVCVESEVGKGTAFTVTLPVAPGVSGGVVSGE